MYKPNGLLEMEKIVSWSVAQSNITLGPGL